MSCHRNKPCTLNHGPATNLQALHHHNILPDNMPTRQKETKVNKRYFFKTHQLKLDIGQSFICSKLNFILIENGFSHAQLFTRFKLGMNSHVCIVW